MEHTDYIEGFVLPAAIERFVYVSISAREDQNIALYSMNFDENRFAQLDDLKTGKALWPNYVIGISNELLSHLNHGFDLCIYGDIPLGAGLSSSAALESAVVLAISSLFDLKLDRMDMAKLGQKCEHEYIGVKCGIMDQFATLFGQQHHVIKLDCRDLSYEYFPLKLGDYVLLLLNTNVKHSLASSAYNQRREQCEKAIGWIKKKYPNVESLRDTSLEMLNEMVLPLDKEAYQKARYVVEEIQRVGAACDLLKEGNLVELGKLLYDTHEGLSNAYKVSCPGLDFLVQQVRLNPAVLGARMMGGGFGGCTLNIVHRAAVDKMVPGLQQAYKKRFRLELDHYVVRTSNGSQIIH